MYNVLLRVVVAGFGVTLPVVVMEAEALYGNTRQRASAQKQQ
jgi:hypothetical protein